MAAFKINDSAKLTATEVNNLQKAFEKISAKIEEAKALERPARDYFSALESIGEQLIELHKYSDDITYNDHEVWIDQDNYYGTAQSVVRFWIPSSMSC